MAADPVIQELIDQLNELTSAAQQARSSTDNLDKATGNGNGGQATGDGSLGHPSQPASQTIAQQALISQFVFNTGGGGSQTSGPNPATSMSPQSPISGIVKTLTNVWGQSNSLTTQGALTRFSERSIAASNAAAEAEGYAALHGGFFTDKLRKGQVVGKEEYRTGLTPPNPRDSYKKIRQTFEFVGQGSDTMRDVLTHGMNTDEYWKWLHETAVRAHENDGEMAILSKNAKIRQSYDRRVINNPSTFNNFDQMIRRDIMNEKFSEYPHPLGEAGEWLDTRVRSTIRHVRQTWNAKEFLGQYGRERVYGPSLSQHVEGAALVAGYAIEEYETIRSLQFEANAVGRMQGGQARSQATFKFEQDRADAERNAIAHAAAAATAITGIGIPVAAAIEAGAWLVQKGKELYFKPYQERIEKDAGISELIRHYGLGDTNKPATERAKEFMDKYQTAAEFKAQLESSLDDLNKGYQRVGLGDFRSSAWQDGGVGFLRRAEQKMAGVAPMWQSPSKIFSMLDSSRLAVRQFASTNVPRAKNRTGD